MFRPGRVTGCQPNLIAAIGAGGLTLIAITQSGAFLGLPARVR